MADKRSAQPVQLLQRQQILLRKKRHILGHAIHAAKIAAVRHGNPQIGNGAAKRVDHTRYFGL
jgi:hypothetical protein